jgi:hypothetical protein
MKGRLSALRYRVPTLGQADGHRHWRATLAKMMRSEDRQISLTDPDARTMATSSKDTGIVGYNMQIAVDTQHHLIVAHESLTLAPIAVSSSTCLSRRAMRSALRRSMW